jgi:hypothetical protein
MKVWICGQTRCETPSGRVWEIQGAFSTEALAVAACRNEAYWVGPLTLDESLPEELIPWPGCYYPKMSQT